MECNLTSVEKYTCLQTNIDIVKPVPLFIDKPDWRIYDCVWFLTSPNYTFITIDIADATLGSGTVLSFGRVVGRYNNVTSLVDSVNLTTSLTNGMIFYSNERNLRMSLSSATYNGRASSLSLLIRFDKDDVCGPRNISIIEPIPFIFPVHNLGLVKCLWFLTSPNHTFIYLDIAYVNIEPKQQLSFGRVYNLSGNEALLEDGISLNKSQPNGTSFYFNGNSIWMSFSHATYINDASPWSLLLRYDDHEGLCRAEQRLCEPDNKCLPPTTLCDGNVDCKNYIDEIDCDICGTTNNHLKDGDSITVLGELPSKPGSFPHFAVYPGNSESIPNNTNVSLVGLDTNECIWIFNEPAGSRVRIKIIEYSVSLLTLQIGSGVDPSYGEPIAIDVTNGNLPECEDEELLCRSGLHCVNTSSVCDGRKHCAAHEDELGCGKVLFGILD
ncbi:uncharacterized protein LOC117299569 [Asterias rubens]|uniref:uncharacterized protein LOC117299569 n=1 Tax=Asterias rubens TaxID=7604 RepID=UPI00145540C1|nr:uncharacterized protein LOC117299569 [Asterias rubens]